MVALFLLLAGINTSPLPTALKIEAKRSGSVCSASVSDFRAVEPCKPTGAAEFTPAPKSYFLWRSDSGSIIWLGRAERESPVAFEPSATALVSVRVRPAVSHDRAEQEIALTLKSRSGTEWIVPIVEGKIQQLRFLALPADRYDFLINTPGYRPVVMRGLNAQRGQLIDLPPINMERLPAITGVVRDGETGKPVSGAEIRSDKIAALTGDDGSFSLTPSGATSELSIVASAANYASQEIIIPLRRAGVRLQPILLTRGSTLRLIVQRDCGDDCATTARLFRRREAAMFSDRWRLVAQKSGAGRNTEYGFDGLAAGKYAVVVEGTGPLQRSVSYLTLDAHEKKEHAIRLNDVLLKGVVTVGDLPLPKASLTFSTDQALWSGAVHTDANGEYSVRVWQSGVWTVTVEVPAERQAFFSVGRLNDDAVQAWDIAIPARAITGRVFDRRTREPIPGAEVVDDVASNAPRKIRSITDQNGEFRLPMADAGSHTIRVQSQGYLSPEAVEVQLTEADTERNVPIALDRGITVFFRIVNAAEEPVPNVAVYDWVGRFGLENRAPYWSDPWGLVSVPLRQGEQKQIYVIDQSGSFGVALADSSANTSPETPIKITLPPPVAALSVLATAKSRPAAGVRFLVRFDGRFLPPRMWDLVTGSVLHAATTDRDGLLLVPSLPVGLYEFWPYQTTDELHDLFGTFYTKAPTKVMLSPGPNMAKIDVDVAQ